MMDLTNEVNYERQLHEEIEENGVGKSAKRIRLDASENAGSPSCSIGSDSPCSVQSPPTPMPHTPPFFSPTGYGSSPDDESNSSQQLNSELAQELLQNGWRRCWSGRERRWYFFNKLTQESRWESPSVPSADGNGTVPQEPYRKFVPNNEWDCNIVSNVRMPERVPLAAFAPHPDMEIIRTQAFNKLRQHLIELCHLKEIMDPAHDCLNQWVMERKTLTDCLVSEQLLPLVGASDDISPALVRDLLKSVPTRMVKVTIIPETRRLLWKYAEAAKKIVETHNVSAENRKLVKWQCESMFDWLRKSQYTATMEEFMARLSFLRSRCQGVLIEIMKPAVESICSRLNNYAREALSTVLHEQRAKLEACNIKVPEEPLPPPRPDKIVPCYSVQLRWPCVPLPEIRMEQTRDDEWVKVTYKDDTLTIKATHFYKLEQLYKYNCFDDRRYDCFLARVWCLLKRHDALFASLAEGVKLQQSLPAIVFDYLHKTFGVTFECFASPFNCYFRQYCSLFADTDGYFGSRGSFFEFTPVSGSMVIHPPYVEEVMNAAIDHAEKLLDNAQGPMSFVLFLPDWRDPLLEALIKAERSRFWRCQMSFAPFDHAYRHGFQHMWYSLRDMFLKSTQGTTVVVLQNAAGSELWPADQGKLSKLGECFRQPLMPLR